MKNIHSNTKNFPAFLCWIFYIFGLKFKVIQYRWGRKLFKGKFIKINRWLSMVNFWTDKLMEGSRSRILKTEEYPKK